jgi:ABC-2 type transport system permease protein
MYAAALDAPGATGQFTGAALAYWPAVMVLVGVSVLLFGWVPRQAIAVSWGVVVVIYMVMIVGDALGLPQGVLNLLPWSATPQLPVEPMTWTPLIVMTLVGLVAGVGGIDRFRRRDIVPA